MKMPPKRQVTPRKELRFELSPSRREMELKAVPEPESESEPEPEPEQHPAARSSAFDGVLGRSGGEAGTDWLGVLSRVGEGALCAAVAGGALWGLSQRPELLAATGWACCGAGTAAAAAVWSSGGEVAGGGFSPRKLGRREGPDDWLDDLIAQLWPQVIRVAKSKESLELMAAKLRNSAPDTLKNIRVVKFELGEEPPTCEVEHVYDRGEGRGVGVNLNVSWHSQTEIKIDTGILGLSLGARLCPPTAFCGAEPLRVGQG